MPRPWSFALAAVLVFAMAACGEVGGWVKPDVTGKQQRRDEEDCNKQAIATAGLGPDARLLYQQCMQAKGYELGKK